MSSFFRLEYLISSIRDSTPSLYVALEKRVNSEQWRSKTTDEQIEMVEQIKRNFLILENCFESQLRFKVALFRLHRYYGFSPFEIASIVNSEFHRSTQQSKGYRYGGYIGEVFRVLCLSSDICVLKKFLL